VGYALSLVVVYAVDMVLLLDNYDSFVYNLARYVSELGWECRVVRNDALTLADIHALAPTHIIISPGPRAPDDAGVSNAVIKQFGPTLPLLGVCLGQQCIGQVFGGRVIRAQRPVHGKTSLITHAGHGLFAGLPSPLRVTRYHSLIVSRDQFPAELLITATSPEGEVMALQHRHWPIYGVQFHPEAVLTEGGHALLKNFLTLGYN